jgi:hypothetical protein
MSSRDRLNYKKAMFNLRRERNVGHHITLQESNSLRLADERIEDELAKKEGFKDAYEYLLAKYRADKEGISLEQFKDKIKAEKEIKVLKELL